MELLLVTSTRDARAAASVGLPLAHLSYQITPQCTLQQDNLDIRGGYMVVTILPHCKPEGNPQIVCRDILHACKTKEHMGVILDIEGVSRPIQERIVAELDAVCTRNGLAFWVSDRYEQQASHGATVVSSALVSGSLHQRLDAMIRKLGAQHVCLEIERLAQDITLPAPQGRGVTLSRDALYHLIGSRRPAVFYSHELCSHYFTYKDEQAASHFVLFDDAVSIRNKLQLARSLNLCGAVLLYSEVQDILRDIV